MIAVAALLAAFTLHTAAPAHHHRPWWTKTPKTYAHHIVMHRWPGQFWAENAIVTPESGWDPCAVYPSQHLCSYWWPEGTGGNACGIAQRYYCPVRWRGRLGAAWRGQVRDLQDYIAARYGSPREAWAYKQAYGTY